MPYARPAASSPFRAAPPAVRSGDQPCGITAPQLHPRGSHRNDPKGDCTAAAPAPTLVRIRPLRYRRHAPSCLVSNIGCGVPPFRDARWQFDRNDLGWFGESGRDISRAGFHSCALSGSSTGRGKRFAPGCAVILARIADAFRSACRRAGRHAPADVSAGSVDDVQPISFSGAAPVALSTGDGRPCGSADPAPHSRWTRGDPRHTAALGDEDDCRSATSWLHPTSPWSNRHYGSTGPRAESVRVLRVRSLDAGPASLAHVGSSRWIRCLSQIPTRRGRRS